MVFFWIISRDLLSFVVLCVNCICMCEISQGKNKQRKHSLSMLAYLVSTSVSVLMPKAMGMLFGGLQC